MNIFVIKSVVEDVKISTIFYGMLPFIITDILRLMLLIAFRSWRCGYPRRCKATRAAAA
jgi:TRAP-type mannitol/chloroaromatic compound transport system permease large subunit